MLDAAVDVYAEWIDKCEEIAQRDEQAAATAAAGPESSPRYPDSD